MAWSRCRWTAFHVASTDLAVDVLDGGRERIRNDGRIRTVRQPARRRRQPRSRLVPPRQPLVQRPPELPTLPLAQVRRATEALDARGTPKWSDITTHQRFYQWLATLNDPFADAFLEEVPDWKAIEGGQMPDPVNVDRLQELAPDAITRFERAQREALTVLIETVKDVDPAPLLAGLILVTQFEPWGRHFEPTSQPTALDVELVSGIVASLSYDHRRPATVQDLQAVAGAAESVRWWAHALSTAYMYEHESSVKDSVRHELLTKWLVWRGSAYPAHAQAAAQALMSGQDVTIRNKLGFNLRDLTDFVTALRQHRENGTAAILTAAWNIAIALTGERPAALAQGSPRFQEEWYRHAMRMLPQALGVPLDGRRRLLGADRSLAELAIIDRLGVRPGTGNDVTSVFADSPHRTRPFMHLPPQLNNDGEEDLPAVALLVNLNAVTTDLHLTVEALLDRTFPKWSVMRARAIDVHTVDLLQRSLPGSRAFTNIFIDGPQGRAEVDGLVIYDDVVIVIEGKGAPLKLPALRGSVDKYVKQLRQLVTTGSEQLDRDRSYVATGTPARFYDRHGRCVAEITGTSVRRCYQMLPCLDGLREIGTSMTKLATLGVIEESATPWIISVTDLNVVIDLLQRPAELVGYLEFRARWLREPAVVVIDELELLVMYLYQVDLASRIAQVPEGGRVMHAPSQAILDAWYDGQAGEGPEVDRPRIKTTKRLRQFVDELQRTRPDGWLATAAAVFQVPISSATALDMCEPGLARRVRREGVVVTGAPDCRFVLVAQEQPYPALDEIAAVRGNQRWDSVHLFLRQHGARLKLENARLISTEPDQFGHND